MGRKLMALLTVLAVSALVGCTSTPARTPRAAVPATGATATGARPTGTISTTATTAPRADDIPSPVRAPSAVAVPKFASTADRDTAFVAQLAAFTWTNPKAGPGYPAKFRRSALGYASVICADARRTGSVADVVAPTDQLSRTDRTTLVRLAALFYCPSLAGSAKPAARPQVATCPRVSDILVTSRMTPPMMSENYFYSTVNYVVAFMNLTDYPVWIQPQVKWRAGPIYKGGYATGDIVWRHAWQPFFDPRIGETTPGRLLQAGEVWRVDAGQVGPYIWKSMAVRADPAAFVPQGCGYQPA